MTIYETSYFTIIRTDENLYSVVERTYPEIKNSGLSYLQIVDLSKGEYADLVDARREMKELAKKTMRVAVDLDKFAVITGLHLGLSYSAILVHPSGQLEPIGTKSTTINLPVMTAMQYSRLYEAVYIPFTKIHEEGTVSDSDSEGGDACQQAQ